MNVEDVFSNLPTLETSRLKLRKFTIHDAQHMFDYSSMPEVSTYVPWETHKKIEDTLEFLNFVFKQYRQGKLAPWAIEYKENRKVIGTIDFVAWSTPHHSAEIGFILSKEYWGRGLVVEAALKVIDFGFEHMKLNRIEALCIVENVQSQRVLQKIGMSLDGVSKEKYLIKEKFRDMAAYSILKKDYYKNEICNP
ncbi:GNAT family protein [Paenibacillus sp. JX-17]|uniref:GNAT family protein n=1 Tax=Paenibacillus lacisoli TaxID=3064525 RepID=A0ABT9CM38_9BACL|nr:GNAT family protein [Paenibacillus sp. JX-17]MDO7908711.1 GNAT family protein [Paenibacillus sp. JX-17]